jgi:DNA ligase-4
MYRWWCVLCRLSGKEVRPDFWVTNPQRSLVVEVKSDIRTIVSKVFATPYSLRFPRITKIW